MIEPGGAFAGRLLSWFAAHRRDLPWRRNRDPWAIWVSEVMLQQTRVEAVRTAFERFVLRFPTAADFAAASDDALLLAWRGLGYYRRARMLRAGAQQVVARHGGVIPNDLASLADLPGVGPYTLGALASIAFERPEVAIDGNVERVVARHGGLREATDKASCKKAIRATATEWLDRHRPGDFNQALMELGALICTPSSPDCAHCPVAADCVARQLGLTQVLPVRKKPRPTVEVTARVVVVIGPRGALGSRLAEGEANAGQVELPGPGVLTDATEQSLAAALRERFGARVQIGAVIASAKHAITHHRIVLHAHAAVAQATGQLGWFALDAETPWTTPSRKVLQKALGTDGELRA